MIPVNQTRVADDIDGGNCFPACIASIFELHLEAVPDIKPGSPEWTQDWAKFLGGMGLYMLEVASNDPNWKPVGYTIGIVGTQTGTPHAVVCLDGAVVHNPDALGTEASATEVDYHMMFVVLNPAKLNVAQFYRLYSAQKIERGEPLMMPGDDSQYNVMGGESI